MTYYTSDLREMQFIPDKNPLGEGTQGKVYKLDDNKCIKIYGEDVIKYNPEIFTLFKELSPRGYYHLFDLLYSDTKLNKIGAYTMEYYRSEIENILFMPAEYTIHSFNILYKGIKLLAENQVLIRDALPKNTILGKDNIILIDLDDSVKSRQSKEAILEKNTQRLFSLFKKIYEENLKKIGKNIEDNELSDYLDVLFSYNREPVKSLQRRMTGCKIPLDIFYKKYRC